MALIAGARKSSCWIAKPIQKMSIQPVAMVRCFSKWCGHFPLSSHFGFILFLLNVLHNWFCRIGSVQNLSPTTLKLCRAKEKTIQFLSGSFIIFNCKESTWNIKPVEDIQIWKHHLNYTAIRKSWTRKIFTEWMYDAWNTFSNLNWAGIYCL